MPVSIPVSAVHLVAAARRGRDNMHGGRIVSYQVCKMRRLLNG
jgi:hypothetical protein